MRKKNFASIVVLAIATMVAFNVNINTQENGLSNVSLENVEALATESSPGAWCCGWLDFCGVYGPGKFRMTPCQ
jgi:hypothetical protein